MNYFCFLSIFLLFVACEHKKEIKNEFVLTYNIDHKLNVIRDNIIDDSLAYRFKKDFRNISFIENTFFSLDTLNIVQLDNHYHVVKNIFSNKFLILINGYYQTELTNGQIIRPYKAVYLYNLETGIALEVSNKWNEGFTSNFYLQDDNLIIKQTSDPSYDLIDSRFTDQDREMYKEYSYLVVKLDDFSIVDEITSQEILSKVVF